MDRPTKHSEDVCDQLRKQYLRVLSEPIPPRLRALVEQLRELERRESIEKRDDDERL